MCVGAEPLTQDTPGVVPVAEGAPGLHPRAEGAPGVVLEAEGAPGLPPEAEGAPGGGFFMTGLPFFWRLARESMDAVPLDRDTSRFHNGPRWRDGVLIRNDP